MWKKVVDKEGKDWDKLLPYVLFAYREVPQASTGFSPFELLYGCSVRGPLAVSKESWQATESQDVTYISDIREKLEQMSKLVQENLTKAQADQKYWYDKNIRQREFQPAYQVLVLLPTFTSRLLAQWQGPYKVVKHIGEVDYLIDMKTKRGKLFMRTCFIAFQTILKLVYGLRGSLEKQIMTCQKIQCQPELSNKVDNQPLGHSYQVISRVSYKSCWTNLVTCSKPNLAEHL